MSEEQLTDEFDDDYVTVAGDYDEAFDKAVVEAAESQVAARVRRHRTYLTSEMPVRPCTSECAHRGTCKDFLSGRVTDGGLCKPELRQIKKWQIAFRKGDFDSLKDDVGTVAGSMAVQVGRLIEAVIEDGVVVETEKVSQGGFRYTEKMAHPALQQAAQLMKTLGIDMNAFLMTPKAAQSAPPQVQVNVGVSFSEVAQRYAKRVTDQDKVDDS